MNNSQKHKLVARRVPQKLSISSQPGSDDDLIQEQLIPIQGSQAQISYYNNMANDPTRISGAITMSQIVDGKLVETRSCGAQTLYMPEYGLIYDPDVKDEDSVSQVQPRSVTVERPSRVSKCYFSLFFPNTYTTHGYFDYKNHCQEQMILKLLMKEIRYDMDYLLKVSELQKEESLIPSLLPDSLPVSEAGSLESTLYEVAGYEKVPTRTISEARPELRFDNESRASEHQSHKEECKLDQNPYPVECDDEECGIIDDPNEEIPMDEFTLARRKIAALPFNQQLKSAVEYLCDKGDALAVLPDIDKVPWLTRWYEIRRGIQVKLTPKDKAVLMDESMKLWESPYFKVTGIPIPELKGKKITTWDHIGLIKKSVKKLSDKYQRMVRQQLVTNARNFFPSMKTEYFKSPLNHSFRRTYFDYLPSREIDSITVMPWRPIEHGERDQGDCGRKANCKILANRQ